VLPDAEDNKATKKPSSPVKVLPSVKKTRWAWIAGTFFGAGLLHPGPGTFGSAAATILWVLVAQHVPIHWLPFITLGMAAVATAIGIPAATRVARESGRKDPQIVVIDEVAGQWLTLTLCIPQIPFALFGLLAFRLFDILKPPPVRQLERLPTGTGIMVDDLGAGVYALLLHAFVLQPLFIGWIQHAHK
jgi:phosphatidylglycerophosphatase A